MLHTTQQKNLLELITTIKQQETQAQKQTQQSLQVNLQTAQERKRYYDNLIKTGISSYEESALDSTIVSGTLTAIAQGFGAAASVAFSIPQEGSPFAITYGGVQLGGSLSGVSQALQAGATISNIAAQTLLTKGNYDRRDEEWRFQSSQIQGQILEIQKQIEIAATRLTIAQQDFLNNKTEITQNQVIETYLRTKFSNKELYAWLAGRVSALYYQQYSLALKVALFAQQAYQYEINTDRKFINLQYWGTAHHGLLAGESLRFSLEQMQQAYNEQNVRRLEIEKVISLKQIAPQAFLALRDTGCCEFTLSEKLFDYDFPGHYQRQIKSISISIPAIIDPYQNINATLQQMHNAVVLCPDTNTVAYLLNQSKEQPDTANLRQDWNNSQQIAISRGIDDAGVFQLDFHDQRYLPFENTGAVCSWKLNIPHSTNRIDFNSISDIIINLKYTALDGGEVFAQSVRNMLKKSNYNGSVYFDLTQSYASQWQYFISDHTNPKIQSLKFDIHENAFQYFKTVNLSSALLKITTNGITIPKSTINPSSKQLNTFINITIGKKSYPVDVINVLSNGCDSDSEIVDKNDWCNAKASAKTESTNDVGIGIATKLNLSKNTQQDQINGQWSLDFNLDAMKNNPTLKKLLINDFLASDKLQKIELILPYCGNPFE